MSSRPKAIINAQSGPTLMAVGPLQLNTIAVHNTDGSETYVQCFDVSASSDVTLGTTSPDYVVPAPANTSNHGQTIENFYRGLYFQNGLAIAATTDFSGSTGQSSNVEVSLGIERLYPATGSI